VRGWLLLLLYPVVIPHKMPGYQLGMVLVYAFNPNAQEAETEDPKFEASPGSIAGACLRQTNTK
jgi:hypothetical protein